ncbi:response regulator [Hymenobacter cavernae]|uniref:Two-component response regulator n=1 Tax=Hymenobacter cavernae TaxID=2044852 RepID=A0ABQ1TQ39_9BACT|nr:response regulator [Hymenobacter cavernae]GGF00146.1 two-component response regulator [Hymenobacter cavernae]
MKILVVDDEMDVRVLFEQRFRREIRSGEFSFSFAYSGEEALAYLHEHASEVVLILSDINMPGMSGLELLRHIRQEYPAPPAIPSLQVMMITAYGDETSRLQAMQLGASDFLTKPVDFAALKTKLISLENHEN